MVSGHLLRLRVSRPKMPSKMSASWSHCAGSDAAPLYARVAVIEVTPAGRAALERVGRAAEAHLAEVLAPLDQTSRRRLRAGLAVLRNVFAASPPVNGRRARSTRARD